jgi:hypothetical protein
MQGDQCFDKSVSKLDKLSLDFVTGLGKRQPVCLVIGWTGFLSRRVKRLLAKLVKQIDAARSDQVDGLNLLT